MSRVFSLLKVLIILSGNTESCRFSHGWLFVNITLVCLVTGRLVNFVTWKQQFVVPSLTWLLMCGTVETIWRHSSFGAKAIRRVDYWTPLLFIPKFYIKNLERASMYGIAVLCCNKFFVCLTASDLFFKLGTNQIGFGAMLNCVLLWLFVWEHVLTLVLFI